MAIEIRPIRKEETTRFVGVAEAAFGEQMRASDVSTFERKIEHDRMHAAFEDEDLVGSAGAFTFNLTIPGNELQVAGVTMVGVLPSHRRRGVLRQMMRTQLDDIRSRGESV